MHRSVLERWIDSISERSFDEPFLILLKAHGFYDIHFTHGSYEFGKDFIAKRQEKNKIKQYGFQSKSGNIGGAEWEKMLGQMEELLDGWLTHPNYDDSVPREHRLILTGILKGKAILSTKQFAERVRKRGNENFLVWDREFLLDLLEGANPMYPINTLPNSIEHIISGIISGVMTRQKLTIELDSAFPRSNSIEELREALLHNSFLISQFLSVGQSFSAIFTAHNGTRLALAYYLKKESEEARKEYLDALQYSTKFGLQIIQELLDLDPIDIAYKSSAPNAVWAAYPVTCFCVLEALGIGALHALWLEDIDTFKELLDVATKFISINPGCTHPLSDQLAASLIPIVSALALGGETQTGEYLLSEITKWVCDKIEHGCGLASSTADTKEEIERIFFVHFDFNNLRKRRESLFAVSLADLSYIFFPELYPKIINDLKAVNAIPSVFHPLDTPNSIFIHSYEGQGFVDINYPDEVQSFERLEHFNIQSHSRRMEELAGPIAPIICACLCRNRLYTDTLPRLRHAFLGSGAISPQL